MQINFNGTNFINAAHVFCLTRGPNRSWRNGDAQGCQLSNIADPFGGIFPFKKSPKALFSLWESPVLPREQEVLLSQHAHTSLSLSLSLCASAQFLFSVLTPLSRSLSLSLSLSVRLLSFCSARSHLSLALTLSLSLSLSRSLTVCASAQFLFSALTPLSRFQFNLNFNLKCALLAWQKRYICIVKAIAAGLLTNSAHLN